MKELTILIKPASSLCNMKCKYCFYYDVSNKREIKSHGIMNTEVMNCVIKNVFNDIDANGIIRFIFQGGEPTLAGIEFYKNFLNVVNNYKKDHIIHYSMQTNGISLDDKWYTLFKENNFLVGISLDGYKENMDIYRFDQNDNSVFSVVLNAIKELDKRSIEYNVLTVITSNISKSAKRLYTFYQKHNLRHIQLIPCMPDLDSSYDENALKPSQYQRFYSDLFDLWKCDINTSKYININIFTNIFTLLQNKNPYQCGILGNCSLQLIVEANGNVYPCDFYVLDQYFLGNVKEKTFKHMIQSPIANTFICNKSTPMKVCATCRYLKICNGGCKRQNITFLNDEFCGYQKLLDKVFIYIEKGNK